MNLHEFQAKELLARSGIRVPQGRAVDSAAAARACASTLGSKRFAVKAQIYGGDRGPAGAVLFADTPDGVAVAAERLLGQRIMTAQTGPKGSLVRLVYVEQAIDDARHLYAAVVLDRSAGQVVLLASGEGGDDFERRAASNPMLIQRLVLSIASNPPSDDFQGLARRIGLTGPAAEATARLFEKLADAFVNLDATVLEINPLALVGDNVLVALDAKLAIDDNALFRHPGLAGLREVFESEERGPEELEAQHHQINYIRMDGDIGLAVNGAGLALATLDLVCDAGGRPSNFMDIRTTASSIDISHGVGLILADPHVHCVLVNVHGGGMQRCDTIAEGIGIAVRHAAREVPIVICMAGNNADFAKTVLRNTGVNYVAASDASDAAAKAISLAKSRSG